MKELKKNEIEKLIDKAANAKESHDALHFSQAACNCANAVMCLLNSEKSSSTMR